MLCLVISLTHREQEGAIGLMKVSDLQQQNQHCHVLTRICICTCTYLFKLIKDTLVTDFPIVKGANYWPFTIVCKTHHQLDKLQKYKSVSIQKFWLYCEVEWYAITNHWIVANCTEWTNQAAVVLQPLGRSPINWNLDEALIGTDTRLSIPYDVSNTEWQGSRAIIIALLTGKHIFWSLNSRNNRLDVSVS